MGHTAARTAHQGHRVSAPESRKDQAHLSLCPTCWETADQDAGRQRIIVLAAGRRLAFAVTSRLDSCRMRGISSTAPFCWRFATPGTLINLLLPPHFPLGLSISSLLLFLVLVVPFLICLLLSSSATLVLLCLHVGLAHASRYCQREDIGVRKGCCERLGKTSVKRIWNFTILLTHPHKAQRPRLFAQFAEVRRSCLATLATQTQRWALQLPTQAFNAVLERWQHVCTQNALHTLLNPLRK
mmetsp:Transcript_121727/g.242482  ORF Transcript_121727/g.242482 Transcript_121727/m.242482 type:complete len:241 (+) Transcript_121727:506-1228(+)